MYYVKHYDENSDLFQIANISNDSDLAMFKDIQMSKGEFALIYESFTDKLVEDYEKN